MNKKTSIFYISTVVVAIACLILDLVFPDMKFSFLGICFGITMLVYGFCLIVRGLRFKIDSSLFLGIIIFAFGVISMLTYFTKFTYVDMWYYLVLSASFSSLATGLYFKSTGLKKLSILLLGIFVILLIYQGFDLVKWWVMLILLVVWTLGFIVVNNLIQARRNK